MTKNEPENTEMTELAAELIDDTKPKSLRFRILRFLIITGLLLLLLIFVAPRFLDNSALKVQLTQKVSQILETKFVIYGKVRVSLLPHLAIIAEDVVLEDYKDKDSNKTYDLYAQSVEVQFPTLSFSGNSVVKKIIFFEPMLASFQGNKALIMRDDDLNRKLTELAKNPPSENQNATPGFGTKLFAIANIAVPKTLNLPRSKIENGKLIIYDKLGRKREINEINLTTKINEQDIKAHGSFYSHGIKSDFKLGAVFNSKSSKKDSYLDVTSQALELHIKGNYISANRGLLRSDFSGVFEAKIMELKSFYQSYVASEGVIATRLKYNSKPISIAAQIDSQDQEIAVGDIKISSDLVSGRGHADFGLNSAIPIADILLDLDVIDFDSIWSNEVVKLNIPEVKKEETAAVATEEKPVANNEEELQKTTPSVDQKDDKLNLEMTKKVKNLDLTAEIRIKKIKYLAGEIIDSDLYFSTSGQGDIIVMPAIFKMPGDSFLRISGVFDNSTAISKFVGEFDAKGASLKEVFTWLKIESQNLKLDTLTQYSSYSNVLLLPNNVTFSNLYLHLNDSEFAGELRFDNDGKAINYSGRIHADKFDVDDHFLISGQNTYLSPGLLIRKLFWLNDVSSSNVFDFSFDKLIYRKEEFHDQSFRLDVRRGYIAVSQLRLQSDQTDLKADFSVDISGKNPNFQLQVDAKKFHYETPKSDNDQIKLNAFDQFFALPSLESFSGNIELSFANATIDNVEVENVKLGGRLKDGNIEDSKVAADFYGGNFSYQGVLGLKGNKTFNGNMTFSNVGLKPLLYNVAGIENISGIGNFAANITTIASSKTEFIDQFKSEIKFSANVPAIDGYGLNDLVRKMFARQNYRDELREPEKILFNSEARTLLDKATGTIQFLSGKDGKMRVEVSGPAINGILSGTVSAKENSVDLMFNVIFLTGNKSKQIPINVATNLKGKIGSVVHNTNLDQVRQYLGLTPINKPIEKSTLITK